jgi:hypothetical protein
VHQVRLSHPHPAVDKQRIVGTGWHRCDRFRRSVGELIARTHDEVVEVELQINLAGRRVK